MALLGLTRLLDMRRILALLALVCSLPSYSASLVTATVTFTNAANLIGTSTITVNSDSRTWTNSVSSPSTQIPISASSGTNIAQQVQLLLAHAAAYPFTSVTPTSDGSTYVALRGGSGVGMTVTLSPTNWGSVTLSTQTIGTGYTLRLPITVESPANQTIIANHLSSALDLSSTPLTSLGTVSSTVKPIRIPTGIVSIEAGSNIALSTNSTSIVVSATGAGIASVGTSNAAVRNILSGSSVLSAEAGTGITLGSTPTSVVFNATAYSPTQLGTSNTTVKPIIIGGSFLSMEAGSGVTLANTSTSVVFTASGGGGSVAVGNSLFVNKSGNDGTGTRNRMDLPFLTIGAAKSAASSGDTIFVFPGSYDEYDIMKNGVNLHFFNGASVDNTSASGAIFKDTTGMTVNITGDGVFTDTSYAVFDITHASAVINAKGRLISGAANTVSISNGDVTLEFGLITASASGGAVVLISGTTATVTFNRTKIKNTAATGGSPVSLSGVNNNLVVRDCVFVASVTGGFSISTGTVNVRGYGTFVSNKAKGAGCTFITGNAFIEVDTDVQ